MSMAMNVFFESIFSLLAWRMELLMAIFFPVGFALVRVELFGSHCKASAAKKVEALQAQLRKTIEAEVAAGQAIAAVKAWRAMKTRIPTQWETLKLVVQAMLEVDANALVNEITGHMLEHRSVLCNCRTAAGVLDVVARAGHVALMEELHKVFLERLQIHPSAQVCEALLSGYASAGQEQQVDEICDKLRMAGMRIRARGYSLIIKGFLKCGMLDVALKHMFNMHRAHFAVPSFAVTQILREACEAGRGLELFESLHAEISVPPEAMAVIIEHCLKSGDLSRAREIEKTARNQAIPLPLGSYEALLKSCIHHSDLDALVLFEDMQKSLVRISESLCINLLLSCADSKFLRFAEEIAKFLRRRKIMTIAGYSALMKVYACAGLYDKACDLYSEITAHGMQPDAMMYGCLMKFAVQCGRTDLSRELFSKAPSVDTQNFMSLIRAAGRDRDVERAFEVLRKLKESGIKPDIAVYNCVLDVCASTGDVLRAREIMAEMRTIGKLDTIAYNTFLKGFCSLGDFRGARELLAEMNSIGMPPNSVSFNCLINAVVSKGMWQEAWDTLDMMERSGVQVDQYTVSIMLKSVKRAKDSKHLVRVLKLLDRSGLNIYSDDVLLSAVLETCVRHREYGRLQNIVEGYRESNIQPTAQTYGALIKACGALKRVDRCWDLWHKMIHDRGLEPNDVVLGSMLEAMVSNECAEEAVQLFQKWLPKIPATTANYTTLIKGFANSRQPCRAMDMWQEIQALKLPMSAVVYNAVIDAQARVGSMDEVCRLVQSMQQNGHTPNSITYSLIVKGYCFTGDLDNAFEVLRDMQQQELANDSSIYNTLLDGCVRNNRMDLADLLLEDIAKFGVAPSNFTLGILVKMYGSRGQLDKAFDIVDNIPQAHGFKANAQVKTCLMSACFYNHDLDSAFKVFEDLRTSEYGADWKSYTSMVSGLLRHGLVEQAVAIVEEAYGLSPGAKARRMIPGHLHKPDNQALEQLLRALVQRGQMEDIGVPLLSRLRAASIPISGKLLSTFTAVAN